VFARGDLALPIEAKGQWNKALWTAATDQLDALYLRDWHAQGRGIYLVFWFGDATAKQYRLKPPPEGSPRPTTPAELRSLLEETIRPERRGAITIVVLDLTR
jgi:hypothetical protein